MQPDPKLVPPIPVDQTRLDEILKSPEFQARLEYAQIVVEGQAPLTYRIAVMRSFGFTPANVFQCLPSFSYQRAIARCYSLVTEAILDRLEKHFLDESDTGSMIGASEDKVIRMLEGTLDRILDTIDDRSRARINQQMERHGLMALDYKFLANNCQEIIRFDKSIVDSILNVVDQIAKLKGTYKQVSIQDMFANVTKIDWGEGVKTPDDFNPGTTATE